MSNVETKTLKSGVVLPAAVVAASYCTIIQILAENPLVLHRLQPHLRESIRGILPSYDFCYLWCLGLVSDDGLLKPEFKDVFDAAVTATSDGLVIEDPVN